jgi:haloacetate dehalogenase
VFEGFERRSVEAQGLLHNILVGGAGPAVLLLHGYPQTHVCWHKVAPALAEHLTVVMPDLRGYGDSAKPDRSAGPRCYAKRTLADDQVQLMQALGIERFAVVGHDRGARVARRLALDYPQRIRRLALLDIVPTATIYATLNHERAVDVWRYFFLVQPYDLPERLIGAQRELYLRSTFDAWCNTPGAITDEAIAEYVRCFDDASIHATCEDYRAGAGVDLEDDAADADATFACPLLLMWSQQGLGRLYDVPDCWHDVATAGMTANSLDCGHFLAEESPDEVADELLQFLL